MVRPSRGRRAAVEEPVVDEPVVEEEQEQSPEDVQDDLFDGGNQPVGDAAMAIVESLESNADADGNVDIQAAAQAPTPVEDEALAPNKPRLAIKQMVLENFKSYAGRVCVGPFHKVSECV